MIATMSASVPICSMDAKALTRQHQPRDEVDQDDDADDASENFDEAMPRGVNDVAMTNRMVIRSKASSA